jgi:light-regulated signal transduction histidine kinase (bacteriophytochrome)
MASQSPVEQHPRAALPGESDAQHFAYIASHDLNAPLRAISGFIELLMAEYGDRPDEQGRDSMQRAVDSTRKMQGMLDDLRVYSRLKPPNVRQQVALAAVLADLEIELGAKMRELGATISRDELPTVQGELAQLNDLHCDIVQRDFLIGVLDAASMTSLLAEQIGAGETNDRRVSAVPAALPDLGPL